MDNETRNELRFVRNELREEIHVVEKEVYKINSKVDIMCFFIILGLIIQVLLHFIK